MDGTLNETNAPPSPLQYERAHAPAPRGGALGRATVIMSWVSLITIGLWVLGMVWFRLLEGPGILYLFLMFGWLPAVIFSVIAFAMTIAALALNWGGRSERLFTWLLLTNFLQTLFSLGIIWYLNANMGCC